MNFFVFEVIGENFSKKKFLFLITSLQKRLADKAFGLYDCCRKVLAEGTAKTGRTRQIHPL